MFCASLRRIITAVATFAMVWTVFAGTSPIVEAAAPWKDGYYFVKYSGTASGYPITRYGLLRVAVGLPPIAGLYGPNPFDICLNSGNPYLQHPGSIQVGTRTPGVCYFDTTQRTATQLATVRGDPNTGQVSILWYNLGGGSNIYGGMNCSALATGGNPNVFVGGNPNELVPEPITVCSGYSNLTFTADGAVTGALTVWGYSLGGFGSSFRAYDVKILCGKWIPSLSGSVSPPC